MVDQEEQGFRKRDFLYVVPLWLLHLILPNPVPHRKKDFRKRDLLYLAGLMLLPWMWPDGHIHHLMVLAGINAILALGLSLFLGYAGQVSLGHAAFLGIGAYTTAILTTRYAIPALVAFWASGLVAAMVAFLIGKPILKLKGYFLALATLGFGEIFLVMIKESYDLTGGVIGIFNIPWFSLGGFVFDTYVKQYYLVWGVLIGLLLFSKNLIRSKTGRALLTIAASEEAAASLGINVARRKLQAFVTSAAFAGLAGCLYASIMSIAHYEAFSLNLSVLIVMMVILGGLGNLYGPVAGAILLTWLMNALSKYQEFSLPIFGIIFILLLVFFPDGMGTRLGMRFVYLISYFPRKKRRDEGKFK